MAARVVRGAAGSSVWWYVQYMMEAFIKIVVSTLYPYSSSKLLQERRVKKRCPRLRTCSVADEDSTQILRWTRWMR